MSMMLVMSARDSRWKLDQTVADSDLAQCKIGRHTRCVRQLRTTQNPAHKGMEVESVSAWLQQLALEKYVQVFAENDIDIDALRLLGEADL
jgi:hypothetical protein